jgi:hypothetical protein
MPVERSKILYWYGYKGANMEDESSANGWSGHYSYTAPVYYTNYAYLYGASDTSHSGIMTKNSGSYQHEHCIVDKTTSGSAGGMWGYSSKSYQNAVRAGAEFTFTGLQHVTGSTPSAMSYAGLIAYTSCKLNVYAYWIE